MLLRKKSEKGQNLIETGLCLILMVPVVLGAFSLGMSLVKGLVGSSVARNANVILLRSDLYNTYNLKDANTQKLIVRMAGGLGMANSDGSVNTSGNGAVILSKIIRIGLGECSQVLDSGGNPYTATTCPNYGYYVFASQVVIGNSAYASAYGSPSSTTDSWGRISRKEYVERPGNRIAGLDRTYDPPANTVANPTTAGGIYLAKDQVAYLSEGKFDVSDVAWLPFVPRTIYVRNFS
jgi:hypothetical protein